MRHRRALEEFEVAEAERWARGEDARGPAGEDVRQKLGESRMAELSGLGPAALGLPTWSR